MFDPNQLGMAIFLLIATAFNIWFVITSYRRAFFTPKAKASDIKSIVEVEPAYRQSYQLLSNAVATMAFLEIPWVWLCMIQCWNNTFHQNNFNQNSGDDSFGCKFMGWYSTFSLVSMMGSHCLVVYYLNEAFPEGVDYIIIEFQVGLVCAVNTTSDYSMPICIHAINTRGWVYTNEWRILLR